MKKVQLPGKKVEKEFRTLRQIAAVYNYAS
jgi:hypothetical protein